jgi:excisionase family DNA binding protein
LKQMNKLVQFPSNQVEGPRLLYSRKEAAKQLSISIRMLDYLIANKQLATRRLGKRVTIPHSELVRFARADHFELIIKKAA